MMVRLRVTHHTLQQTVSPQVVVLRRQQVNGRVLWCHIARQKYAVTIEVQRCELEIEWSTVNTNHVTLNLRLLLPCHNIVYRL